ncbi:unnamed protein product [Bursaphelenchus xylophilus]|uniref:non-specific serine/threonine protein kinase n=1 Tax=Bursaphelenchus xylophilus TaxID=6326 RepID=A0A1I7SQB7_BURXY|nr:unnamed protein product [Bursaphelenchus xylophilus]CAG9109701.1 unnamed protein product [Bursaphelenchus xylophilus]
MKFQCVGTKKQMDIGVNRYFIKYEIAKGGFSNIYLARNILNKQKYAMKKIYAHSQLEVSRIRREIYAHYAFGEHEHLMKIHGVYREKYGEGSYLFWLVMDYCPLGSLQNVLDKQSKLNEMLPEKQIVSYISQILSALQYMHSSEPSIAHRDIKPANCLRLHENHIVLTDFGSAVMVPVEIDTPKRSQELKDEAAELCTMPYRAPELFNCDVGTKYDHKVDVWSAGCVLYALCFHCSPFDAVAARGDSIALATLSYKFKEAPVKNSYSEGLMSILRDMLTVSTVDRPNCDTLITRLDSLRIGS